MKARSPRIPCSSGSPHRHHAPTGANTASHPHAGGGGNPLTTSRLSQATLALAFAAVYTIGLNPAAAQVPDEPPPVTLPDAEEYLAEHPDYPTQSTVFLNPDFNNDTIEDLVFPIAGVTTDEPVLGKVEVVSGWDAETIISVVGEEPGDLFGFNAFGNLDFNGDGFQDLVVTAPANSSGAQEAGKVYLYSGNTGDLLLTITGQRINGGLGWAAAPAGDVNNDGFDDLILGEPLGDQPGRAYVFFGEPDGAAPQQLTTDQADMMFADQAPSRGFGVSVAGAGDVNADGHDDLIIGAPGRDIGSPKDPFPPGAAYVYSGATGEPLMTITGEALGLLAGWSVSSAGDINSDGHADVILGAIGEFAEDGQGGFINDSRAFIFFGGPEPIEKTTAQADLTLEPTVAGDILFGANVEIGNDTANNDGAAEVPVTAFSTTENRPRAYVYSGNNAGLLDTFLLGEPPADDPNNPGGGGDVDGIGDIELILRKLR